MPVSIAPERFGVSPMRCGNAIAAAGGHCTIAPPRVRCRTVDCPLAVESTIVGRRRFRRAAQLFTDSISMTHCMRPRGLVSRSSGFNAGAGRIAFANVVVHVHAGSPPPPRQVVVGIAAPPMARGA